MSQWPAEKTSAVLGARTGTAPADEDIRIGVVGARQSTVLARIGELSPQADRELLQAGIHPGRRP